MSHSFGPSRLTRRRAKTSCGNARITSTVRMMRLSDLPRRYAADMPAAAPVAIPIAVAARAISSSAHPPFSTRDRTSRPRKSPPSGNCPEGLAKGRVSSASGDLDAMNGPTTAISTITNASARPTAPRGVRAAVHSTDSHG